MGLHDQETRQRLLEAGARLFAARGFTHVTVREICGVADANVAAVNYHFRDKLGLYTEVVRTAINAMRGTSDAAAQADEGSTAEERLGKYIRVFLQRVIADGRESWIHKLMAREMAEPTPALDLVVEQAIRPRMAHLAGLVAELLHCPVEDERVARCAASIQAQCVAFIPNAVGKRLYPDFKVSAEALDSLTDHIVAFSLAGIRALNSW